MSYLLPEALRFARLAAARLFVVAVLALSGCTVRVPTLNQITPEEATGGTMISMRLSGANFEAAGGIASQPPRLTIDGALDESGGVRTTSTTLVDPLNLDATLEIDAAAAGHCFEIRVLNPSPTDTLNGKQSEPKEFYVDHPTGPKVPRLFKINGSAMGGDYFRESTAPVTLEGAEFDASAQIDVVGDGVTVSNLNVISPTEITADLTIGAAARTGLRDVRVTGTGGTSGRRKINIVAGEIDPPRLRMAAPNFARIGGISSVDLYGSGFDGSLTAELPPEFTEGFVRGIVDERRTEVSGIKSSTLGSFPLAVRSLRGVSNTVDVKVILDDTPLPALTHASVNRRPSVSSDDPDPGPVPLLPGTNVIVYLSGRNFGAGGLFFIQSESAFTPQQRYPSTAHPQTEGAMRISIGGTAAPRKYFLAVQTAEGLTSNALPLEVGPAPGTPRLLGMSPNRFRRGTDTAFTMTVENLTPGISVRVWETSNRTRVLPGATLNAAGTEISGTFRVEATALLTGDQLTNFYVEQGLSVSNLLAFDIIP